MKCFGKNQKALSKISDKETLNSKIYPESPSGSLRAQFRKSNLKSNTDSGLYSDESGPEDRPRLLIKHSLTSPSESISNSSSPNTLTATQRRLSQPRLQTPDLFPDGWYQSSPAIRAKSLKECVIPCSEMQLLDCRSLRSAESLNISESNISNVPSTPKTPIVKINREAFDRLNSEYLSEYDSEEEMDKTLAQCIAHDETNKTTEDKHSTSDSITIKKQYYGNNSFLSEINDYKADNSKLTSKIDSEDELYSEINKNSLKKQTLQGDKKFESKVPVDDISKELIQNELSLQCDIQRLKTLQSLSSLLVQVNLMTTTDNQNFNDSQILKMKNLCNGLYENLFSFEKLGLESVKDDLKGSSSKVMVNKCIKSLRGIQKNIFAYINLLGSLSTKQTNNVNLTNSIGSIVNTTKQIPEIVRCLNYTITKKQNDLTPQISKNLKKDNIALISEDAGSLEKQSAQPMALDLVQNIHDLHIYDEVASDTSTPNMFLAELNSMISELSNDSSVTNKQLSTKNSPDEPLYEKINSSPIFKHSKSGEISPIDSKLPRNDKINPILNKESIQLLNFDQKNKQKSTASLHELETKFASLLNMLSVSQCALPNEQGIRILNKSLNDLKKVKNTSNENNVHDNSDTLSLKLLQSCDLNSQSYNQSKIRLNNFATSSPIIEKKFSRQLMEFPVYEARLNGQVELSKSLNTLNKNDLQQVKCHNEICANLKMLLETKEVSQYQPSTNSPRNSPDYAITKILDHYSLELGEHWKILIKMSDAFFEFVEHLNLSFQSNEKASRDKDQAKIEKAEERISHGPGTLMNYVKLVVQAGQKIVQVTDILLYDLADESGCLKIENLSEALCEALKLLVSRTKEAATRFKSIPHLQSLVDSVKVVTDRAGDMRATLCHLKRNLPAIGAAHK